MTEAEKARAVLPEAFLVRLQEIVPADRYAAVVASFSRPRAPGLRINTLRAAAAPVVARLEAEGLHLHPVAWMDTAFWVEPQQRDALLRSAAYADHHIYVQNLSSMIPPLVLAPEPGERVLDLCAAPGSKTLQIACRMQHTGEIAAVEWVRSRFFKLRDNLAAQGATAVRTFLKNGEVVWRHRPEYFDRVLLDAPCSTEGRFAADDPNTYAYWSPRKVKEMAGKQRRLLYSAVQCLRVGGTLVYSTCSFSPEENEAVLDHILRRFGPALSVTPLGLDLPNMQPPLAAWKGRRFEADFRHARRILPGDTMEAFFVCRVTKHASTR